MLMTNEELALIDTLMYCEGITDTNAGTNLEERLREMFYNKEKGDIQSGEIRMQTHSANNSGTDNELSDKLNQPIGEDVITGKDY